MPKHATLHETYLFAALDQGASLITVNRRLSRSFLHRYHLYAQAQGQAAWETPDILPWHSWIARCLEQAVYLLPEAAHPLPLTQDQELALWEEIILSSPRAQGVLHVKETARHVRQAWTLFCHWGLEKHTDPLLWISPDQEAFLEWSQEFQDLVDGRGWLEEARHPEYIIRLLESGSFPCPQTIILAGFEQISPVQEHILDVLNSRDCPTYFLEFEDQESNPGVLAAADRQQEIEYAACWARTHLRNSPDQRLGIIVPDLSQVREEMEHTLDAALPPDLAPSPLLPPKRAYDISLGQSLSTYPLIQAALQILELHQDPLPLSTVSALLTSPFTVGADSETCARGEVEAALRTQREAEISWSSLLHLASSREYDRAPQPCPLLAQGLRSFSARWNALPLTQPPSSWARDLDALLRDMGWPGQRTLDSREYQTVQSFTACLQRLAGLDRVIADMSFRQTVSRLHSILTQTIFQPEGPQARVQIMGILEAVGERFDRLWIMGLTDQTWPPGPEPSPFLPPGLQRRLAMPRSCPEHELEYARTITARLQHSAPQIILSWPKREEDRELLPSPLLQGFPDLDPEDLHLEPFPDPWLNRPYAQHLEPYPDEQGPVLSTSGRAPGGTGLLRSQAACPFQAFARHRLGAKALEEPVPGLGPPERGTLIHSALEHFWRDCGDQATLLALSGPERRERAASAAEEAIREMRSQRPRSMPAEFTTLEHQRLINLILEWLQLETGRDSFQVQALEKRLDIHIQGLNINVVVDRIDRLQDGKLVIIDYKAGRHSMSEWFQDRPIEPQIPLYSLFCPEPVAGVYFGVVRKGECRFVGLGEEEGIVPGCKGFDQHKLTQGFASWEDLLSTWKTQLEDLAQEVVSGQAQVSPSNEQACRQCDLHPLCRIFELQD